MTEACLGLPAPAKLNLFLHVTGRRPDGKHLLQSIFTLIDLADTVDLALCPSGKVEREGDLTGPAEDDLCVRAARLLKERFRIDAGVRIRLEKRIPVGAGLGGGSSDAATVLIGLNRLWNLRLTRTELMTLGVELGADVPFFLFGRNAFAEGIGERLLPMDLPDARFRLIWPGRGVSTGKIFSAPDLTRSTETRKIAVFSDSIRNRWPALPGHNDLEPVAARIEPAVQEALRMLSDSGFEPRMTGSGSTVFAVEPEGAPKRSLNLSEGWREFRVRSLPVHPLASWLTE